MTDMDVVEFCREKSKEVKQTKPGEKSVLRDTKGGEFNPWYDNKTIALLFGGNVRI